MAIKRLTNKQLWISAAITNILLSLALFSYWFTTPLEHAYQQNQIRDSNQRLAIKVRQQNQTCQRLNNQLNELAFDQPALESKTLTAEQWATSLSKQLWIKQFEQTQPHQYLIKLSTSWPQFIQLLNRQAHTWPFIQWNKLSVQYSPSSPLLTVDLQLQDNKNHE